MTPRINKELKFEDLFPYRVDHKCRCGCNRELTGKKTCWYSKSHMSNAWKKYAFQKGYSWAIRNVIYQRDSGRCKKCGKFCGKKFEVHHLIPIILHGDNSKENLVTLCSDCHKTETAKLKKQLAKDKKKT